MKKFYCFIVSIVIYVVTLIINGCAYSKKVQVSLS